MGDGFARVCVCVLCAWGWRDFAHVGLFAAIREWDY